MTLILLYSAYTDVKSIGIGDIILDIKVLLAFC